MRFSSRQCTAAMALAVLFSFVVIGCGSERSAEARSDDAGAYSRNLPLENAKSSSPLHDAARDTGAPRDVIRNGQLAANVSDVNKASKNIKEAVTGAKGYVVSEVGENLSSESPSVTMEIRVPEVSFDAIVSQIEAQGPLVTKNIVASDVTEDILTLEAAIQEGKRSNGSQSGIGQLQQQQEALKLRSKMSTIQLRLDQKANADLAGAKNATWSGDAWNSALTSAMGAFRVIGAGFIWALAYTPVWGTLLAIAYFARRQKKAASGT